MVALRRECREAGRGGRRTDGRLALGRAGEAIAADLLRRGGYEILARNYRCRGGEVDLVVTDARMLVFVEVKTRRGTAFGSPIESVGARKQRRLAKAARHFMASRRCCGRAVRFDVIGVSWDRDYPVIDHVENAFDVG